MNHNIIKTARNKEALEAYQALKSNKKNNLNNVIKKLNSFQLYLEKLCNQITKRKISKQFVFQWVFTNKIKKGTYINYCKANLIAASKSLSRIIFKFEKTGMNKVLKRMLLDFICDLKPFIKRFDEKQDYTWLLLNTNSHITNFYYDLAENIFWKGTPGEYQEEQIVLATSTPFIIRQSIEYKIKRILGIEFIQLNGKLQKTIAKVYFKALRENMEYYKVYDYDFKLIKKIHCWAHYYVHGGYRAEPWRTETALNYLKKFFYSGKISQKNSYSLYASVEVNEVDLVKLRKKTEESIKQEVGANAIIKWLLKPEVAVITAKEK